jgi:hypothetical protein
MNLAHGHPEHAASCPSFSSASHDRDHEQGEQRFDHVVDRQLIGREYGDGE